MVTMLSESTPTARKEHRCDWCAEAVEVGEQYERWSYILDGDFITSKMHRECLRAAQDSMGDLLDDDVFCGETYPHPRGRGCSTCEPRRDWEEGE